jgi:hypothetical protein
VGNGINVSVRNELMLRIIEFHSRGVQVRHHLLSKKLNLHYKCGVGVATNVVMVDSLDGYKLTLGQRLMNKRVKVQPTY